MDSTITASSRPEVTLCEVGPRDGLQNESDALPTETKRELISRLGRAGLSRIEVTSFVSPKWIPQLADADALAELLPESAGVVYSALVPNLRGYERFRAAGGIQVAAVFLSASETHNRKNLGCGVAEQLERIRPVVERCRADGVPVRAYVSTVCGCPYEGTVSPRAVLDCARALDRLGVQEISLGDTIGVAHPGQLRALLRSLSGELPLERLALHLHDTYGRALVNAQAGFEAGIRTFDASIGGLGGCPYAPGASGNAATEDLVDLFEREGVATGVDLEALVDIAAWLEDEVLHRTLPGRTTRAMRGNRTRAACRREGA